MCDKLTQEILHSLVLYHPTTGLFTKTDGTFINQSVTGGRLVVALGRYGQHYAHRLAFLFMEGKWPENLVDHINGNGLDNRWTNIRHATKAQNQQNCLRPRGKIGVLGVSKTPSGKFKARITHNGVQIRLGTYDTVKEAYEVYAKVKKELHPYWNGEV